MQDWSPYYTKDIDRLEGIQRHATKMIERFKELTYEERLKRTGLISLEQRRVRGDLIQVFKILKEIDRVDHRDYFEIISAGSKTRGHNVRLVKKRSRLDLRKYFFSQRVVNSWNLLPQDVVDADSVNSFKKRLDRWKVF